MSIEVTTIIIVVVIIVVAGAVYCRTITNAVRHAKPTIINHGTVHNHYYENDEQNVFRSETLPVIVEGVVETLKAVNNGGDNNKTRKTKTALNKRRRKTDYRDPRIQRANWRLFKD